MEQETKKINRSIKIYPIFASFTGDLIFFVPIDTLFLTLVKGLNASQITAMTMVALIICIVFQKVILAIVKKIGNVNSLRLGATMLLIASLVLTFGKSFIAMLLYKSIHELAVMFLNMDEIILKNNLKAVNRKDDYFKIRNKSKIIYAIITLFTALVAGKMFNVNNYLPMYLSIIIYVLVLGTAFLYYESKVNLQNNSYVPNVGEYWYKYKRNSTSVITILSSATDIRFKILNVDTLAVMYDSAKDDDTHKTSFTGSGGWCCAEKARLTTVVGTEYYLVVYCTNPTEGVSLRTGSIATAVGNPVMCAASTKIIPGTSVTATGSGYSSTRTFSVSGDDIPNTAQVRTISLSGTGMSKIKRWRLMAPNKSVWVANESDFYPSINFNFVNDSSSNAKLKGTWSVAFQSSSSSYTFIPSYSVSYYYEYGD